MKKIMILVLLLFIANCKDDINSSKETLFDQEDIEKLSINNLSDFWNGDSIFTEKVMSYIIVHQEGFLKGEEYRSEEFKLISIMVFDSQQNAIKAMEEYRINISAATNEGESNDIIKEKWWYIIGSNYQSIFVNKYNTLVFVSNTHSEDKNISINTALEIMDRIEALSK